MSRLRRVVEASKMLAVAGGREANPNNALDPAGEDAARRFSEMVAAHTGNAQGERGAERYSEPATATPSPAAVEVSDQDSPEPPVRSDAEHAAAIPEGPPDAPMVLERDWRVPVDEPTAGAGTTAKGWQKLEPGALAAYKASAAGKTSTTPAADPVRAENAKGPSIPAPPALGSAHPAGAEGLPEDLVPEVRFTTGQPSPAALAGRGVRAWLSAQGTVAGGAVAGETSAAVFTSTRWADTLRRQGAAENPSPTASTQPTQTDSTGDARPADAPKPVASPPQAADQGAGGQAQQGLFRMPDPTPAQPMPSGSPQANAPGARPGQPPMPDGYLSGAPGGQTGPVRIRVPTAAGEMVRGNLHLDSEARAVRLTLAPQEAETARSMSSAHEMLRSSLAEEGYKLNSYVVRHEGRNLFRADTADTSDRDGDARTEAGAGDSRSAPDEQTRDGGGKRRPAPELSDDPVVAGWFM